MISKVLIIIGIILIVAGVLWNFLPLGKLPGDLKIEKGHTKIYIPLATSIILSIILTLVFWIFSLVRK